LDDSEEVVRQVGRIDRIRVDPDDSDAEVLARRDAQAAVGDIAGERDSVDAGSQLTRRDASAAGELETIASDGCPQLALTSGEQSLLLGIARLARRVDHAQIAGLVLVTGRSNHISD
jgi:hypothetical protein